MKLKLSTNSRPMIEVPKTMPEGWDDENAEMDLVWNTDGEYDELYESDKTQFNSLCVDNRGRFFLTVTQGCDLDPVFNWKSFHQVSLIEAMQWAIFTENRGRGSTGSLMPLLEAAIEIIEIIDTKTIVRKLDGRISELKKGAHGSIGQTRDNLLITPPRRFASAGVLFIR